MNTQKQFYRCNNLSAYPAIIHGISTRSFGSMRRLHPTVGESLEKFSEAVSIDKQQIVRMQQVHGANVVWVTAEDAGKTIPATDALLTAEKGLFLSIVTADCVPILIYDPRKQYVGVIHAGWRGLYNEIIVKTVEQMIEKGSNPRDIVAAIGPCIRSCHYAVGKDFVKKFSEKFKDTYGVHQPYIIEYQEQTYCDLPLLASLQLEKAGLVGTTENGEKKLIRGNIEDMKVCTFESKQLYSYRREGAGMGEFMSIIGMV